MDCTTTGFPLGAFYSWEHVQPNSLNVYRSINIAVYIKLFSTIVILSYRAFGKDKFISIKKLTAGYEARRLVNQVKALESLGWSIIREREHIVMVRDNVDGSQTPLVMPNKTKIKSGTLRSICTQVGVSREEFMRAYERS